MKGIEADDRRTVTVSGPDARDFLQGLITSDVDRASEALSYGALLTPQGKYLFDFFLQSVGQGYRLDVAADRAAAFVQRLAMYRLRARVDVSPGAERVFLVRDTIPGQVDPRHAALGSRLYGDAPPDGFREDAAFAAEYGALCVRHGIPRSGIELLPDASYILEAGFERMGGVDFRKGCYVGQEVTARMRHKTELRKGLVQVKIDGDATPGAAVETADGREAGHLHSVAGGLGLAYLRLDRAAGPMRSGSAELAVLAPVWEMP